jgi:hypothetical protein
MLSADMERMGTLPRMTPEDFDALGPRLGRLSPESVAVARSVLVDGLGLSQAGERHGVSRQRVHGIVKRFRAAAVASVPTRWKRVEVWLPPELAAEVEAMAERARSELAAGEGE